MALVRWEPVTVNRLFSNLFDTPTGSAPARRWVPATDLAETPDAYVLRADLPGMSPEDVHIELENRVLSISGERRAETTEQGAGFHRVERAFGSFHRSLTLPAGVDAEAITASFDQGVLTVRVPKPEAVKPRRVSIAIEGAAATPAVEAGHTDASAPDELAA
jgi:HSP20 family protein